MRHTSISSVQPRAKGFGDLTHPLGQYQGPIFLASYFRTLLVEMARKLPHRTMSPSRHQTNKSVQPQPDYRASTEIARDRTSITKRKRDCSRYSTPDRQENSETDIEKSPSPPPSHRSRLSSTEKHGYGNQGRRKSTEVKPWDSPEQSGHYGKGPTQGSRTERQRGKEAALDLAWKASQVRERSKAAGKAVKHHVQKVADSMANGAGSVGGALGRVARKANMGFSPMTTDHLRWNANSVNRSYWNDQLEIPDGFYV